MPLCTYLSPADIKRHHETLKDKELIEELEEANRICNGRWSISTSVYPKPKRMFKELEHYTIYRLYFYLAGYEYQVINLPTCRNNDHQGKFEILSYLMGYTGGFNDGQRDAQKYYDNLQTKGKN